MKKYYTQTYRPLLQGVVDKCEDEFEKKLVYIAAGALGLSFAFVSDIVNIDSSCCLWMLLSGWVLLIGCICLNCISHLLSKKYAQATINEIDEESKNKVFDESCIRPNIDKRNRKTNKINTITICLMAAGIIFILAYASINILKSKNEETTTTKQTKTDNDMKEFDNTEFMEREEYVGLGHSMPSPMQAAPEVVQPASPTGENEIPMEQVNDRE